MKTSRNFMDSDGTWKVSSSNHPTIQLVQIQIVFICKYYNFRINFSSTLQNFDKEKVFDRPRNIQFLPFIVLLRIKSIQTQLTRNILLLFLLHFSFTTFITTQGLISFHHIFFLDDIPPQSKSIWKRLQTIHVWIISMLGFLLSITFFSSYTSYSLSYIVTLRTSFDSVQKSSSSLSHTHFLCSFRKENNFYRKKVTNIVQMCLLTRICLFESQISVFLVRVPFVLCCYQVRMKYGTWDSHFKRKWEFG